MARNEVLDALKALGVDDLLPLSSPVFALALAEAEKLAPSIVEAVNAGESLERVAQRMFGGGALAAAAYRIQSATSDTATKVAVAGATSPPQA
jgi:hypothetical protein